MSGTARNLLFVMADEHQAAALSGLQHPLVQTPHLDALLAQGTCFRNAFTPSPICVPARAALATGRPVHQSGYWDNAHAYDGRLRSWGHALQDAGISTTSIGKLHYRSADDDTGFDRQIRPMHIADGIGQVWGSVRNPLPDKRRGSGMLGQIGAGLSSYNQYDLDVAAAAVDWLQDPARTAEPWAAFVSFVAPHFPLTVPQQYLDLYPEDAMPLPSLHPDRGYMLHPWVARMNVIEDSDAELGTDSARRKAIAAYFALCSFVDAQIGKVLAALDASGQRNDTLIIYASDHGETLGQRGRWGKSVLYADSTQVPLICAGPGFQAGHQVTTAVSLLDIAPTITHALGAAADPDWTGKDLTRIAAQPHNPDRLVFSEYHAANAAAAGMRLASSDWSYHAYAGYEEELFDRRADPLESVNLAANPAHRAQLTQMRAALANICDPHRVDALAKADQDRLVARFGGPDAAFAMGPSGATKVPQ